MDRISSASASQSSREDAQPQENNTSRTTRRGLDKRAQPWRGHWPPADNTELVAAYGFKKGEVVHIFGN